MGDTEECNVVKPEFSDDGVYYVLTCKGPGVPQTLLRSAFINQTSKRFLKMLGESWDPFTTHAFLLVYAIEDNANLKEYVATKALPVVKYEKIPLGDGYGECSACFVRFLLSNMAFSEAVARILYPPGFDLADTEASYPLLQRV